MGGIAAVIDWQRPSGPRVLDSMMDVVSHRGTAGIQRFTSDQAQLAEARTSAEPDWQIASEGGVTLVGDFRLWNKGPLRDVAGGSSATSGMNDRQLVLAGYRRVGWRRMLDALDGDFAFVVWDSEHRSLLAVRDHFGVIPLYYQGTATGVRIATEPKQLLVVSEQVRPDRRAIADFLADRRTCERDTYFEGVHRVLPAEVLVATEGTLTRHRYWNPEPMEDLGITRSDVPFVYREHLTDAVKRRLDTSSMTISQLSGGLDSTSIAASAQVLTEQGFDADRFATVSYIVPGSTVDESKWISEIVREQPFAHHEFVPTPASIDGLHDDMWRIDRPFVNPNRDYYAETVDYGRRMGADLLLTGNAGDDLMDDHDLIADMLRQGSLTRALRTLRATAAWSHVPIRNLAVRSLKAAVPRKTKEAIRRVMPLESTYPAGLLSDDLCAFAMENPVGEPDLPVGFPSITQAGVVFGTRSTNLHQVNETMEAQAAGVGMSVSHPHLDRTLVEFVASIPIALRPADGRTKTIVRQGYLGLLPDSVIDRTSKTIADDYTVDMLIQLTPTFTDLFPSVTGRAAEFIDNDRYERTIQEIRSGRPDITTCRRIWPAWTLMMWLETLHRYRDDLPVSNSV